MFVLVQFCVAAVAVAVHRNEVALQNIAAILSCNVYQTIWWYMLLPSAAAVHMDAIDLNEHCTQIHNDSIPNSVQLPMTSSNHDRYGCPTWNRKHWQSKEKTIVVLKSINDLLFNSVCELNLRMSWTSAFIGTIAHDHKRKLKLANFFFIRHAPLTSSMS